jgi:hypothetical protein
MVILDVEFVRVDGAKDIWIVPKRIARYSICSEGSTGVLVLQLNTK